MMQLGANRVDSFDISSEAIKRCKQINPNSFVKNIMELEPNPIYDFVLSWGYCIILKTRARHFQK